MTTSGKEKKKKKLRWLYTGVFPSQMSYILEIAIKASQTGDQKTDGFVVEAVFLSFVDCFGVDSFFLYYVRMCVLLYGRWCQISSWLRGYSFLKVKAVPVTLERIQSLWVEWLDLLSSQVGTEPVDCISQVCNKSYSYSFLFLRVHLSQNLLEILQILVEDRSFCLFRKLFCAVLYVFFFSHKCMKTFGRG